MAGRNLLFVYGTLKRGLYNNLLMVSSGCKYVADARLPNFQVVDIHYGFPYMIQADDCEAWGEMWEFDKLEDIYNIIGMELGVGYKLISLNTTNGDMVYAFLLEHYNEDEIMRRLDGEMWQPMERTYEQEWTKYDDYI
jgi:gamma-glutamylcyclotransferase (GGCT)/AIG2-like uncharacterized protein YtfP